MNKVISVGILGLLVIACTVFPAQQAQAGDQMQGMIKHNRNLINIMKRNGALCNKAIVQVKAYHKKNIADFERKKKQTYSYLKNLSKAQQQAWGKRYSQKIMKLMGEMLNEGTKFEKKCPKRGKEITHVFKAFSLGNK